MYEVRGHSMYEIRITGEKGGVFSFFFYCDRLLAGTLVMERSDLINFASMLGAYDYALYKEITGIK